MPAGNRTRNLQRRRLSLYPIALQTHGCIELWSTTPPIDTAGCRFGCRFFWRCAFCGKNQPKTATYRGISVKSPYRVLASEALMVSNSTTGTCCYLHCVNHLAVAQQKIWRCDSSAEKTCILSVRILPTKPIISYFRKKCFIFLRNCAIIFLEKSKKGKKSCRKRRLSSE